MKKESGITLGKTKIISNDSLWKDDFYFVSPYDDLCRTGYSIDQIFFKDGQVVIKKIKPEEYFKEPKE